MVSQFVEEGFQCVDQFGPLGGCGRRCGVGDQVRGKLLAGVGVGIHCALRWELRLNFGEECTC